VESYWELLKNLDAGIRLALIARLAESLQPDVASAGVFPPAFLSGTGLGTPSANPTNREASDTFWWDALEE
jgi:hypothetical protein